MISRRRFCQYLAAATAGVAVADIPGIFSRATASEYFSATELTPGTWLIAGGGGNILLLENDDHPLLVDAGVGAIASELMEKVTSRIGTQSCTLLNTHHHGDHIGGNYAVRQTFGNDVQIIAHDNLVPRLSETLEQSIMPGLMRMAEEDPALKEMALALSPDDFAPSHTFAKDHDFKVGRLAGSMYHFGPGHTDNDAVVHLPEPNILHVGDLVFNELHPYVFPEHGATIIGWQHSLDQAQKLCDADTQVICGHGEIGGPEILSHMHDYFSQVVDIVEIAIAEGRSRQEVAELKPDVFAQRGFADVQHMSLTRAFDELSAQN